MSNEQYCLLCFGDVVFDAKLDTWTHTAFMAHTVTDVVTLDPETGVHTHVKVAER